jgi:hypothetical protein
VTLIENFMLSMTTDWMKYYKSSIYNKAIGGGGDGSLRDFEHGCMTIEVGFIQHILLHMQGCNNLGQHRSKLV